MSTPEDCCAGMKRKECDRDNGYECVISKTECAIIVSLSNAVQEPLNPLYPEDPLMESPCCIDAGNNSTESSPATNSVGLTPASATPTQESITASVPQLA